MSAVRLSICIATLNRAAFIGETLESIVSQITPEVELVVVDGASTDNTEAVVRSFAARCPRLRYVRLEKKGGVDQDYCKAVELAQGDYCWLFTDDDLLKPGAVAAVLEATSRNFSLIVVNAEVRTPDLAVCLQASRLRGSDGRVYGPDADGRNQLLADAGNYLSFIGGVVIRRDLWNVREKTKYFGTEFIHLGVIFQSPLPDEALVMARPWIVIRYGNALWTAKSFQIWMFKFPQLIWSFPDCADWAKQQVEHREPWKRWERLLQARALGQFSVKEFDAWLAPHLKPSPRKLLTRAIACLPVRPLNWLARVCVRHIACKDPSITLFDLEAGWKRSR